MFNTAEMRSAFSDVRIATEQAAAEKWGSVVDLHDDEIRGAYFKNIREAGNDALTSLGDRGGPLEALLYCECVTPSLREMQVIDDSSDETQDGSSVFRLIVVHGDPGGLEQVASWDVRVAGVLDFDGDGQ